MRKALQILVPLLCLAILIDLAGAEDDDNEIGSVCRGDGPVDQGCPLVGNHDFYGTGVRIGIYFQWITSWLANNFLPEEIITSLETNSIFLLALFSTVSISSLRVNRIRVIDILVIHQLCLGFLFSIMSLWGYRTMYYKTEGPGGRRHFGGFGAHFRLILMGAITAYGFWFWARGVETWSECDQRDACGGLDAFIFTPVKVKSRVARSLNITLATGALVYYGAMTITAAIAGVFYLSRKLRGLQDNYALIARPDKGVALDVRELTTWYIVLSVCNLFWLVLSIVNIEFTLNLNHVNNVIGGEDIGGAGQMIPFLIGLISLLKVLYELAQVHLPWFRNIEEQEDEIGVGLNQGAYSSRLQQRGSTNDLHTSTAANAGATPPFRNPPCDSSSTGAHRLLHRPPTLPLPQSQNADKRSLTHRILLAWLPWLHMFEWSRRSLTPGSLRDSTIFGRRRDGSHGSGGRQGNVKHRDPNTGFEALSPPARRKLPQGRFGGGGEIGRGHVRAQSSATTTTTTTFGTDADRSSENLSTAALLRPSPPSSAQGFRPRSQSQSQTRSEYDDELQHRAPLRGSVPVPVPGQDSPVDLELETWDQIPHHDPAHAGTSLGAGTEVSSETSSTDGDGGVDEHAAYEQKSLHHDERYEA